METEQSIFAHELRILLNEHRRLRDAGDVEAPWVWVRDAERFVQKWSSVGRELPAFVSIAGTFVQPASIWLKLEHWTASSGMSLNTLNGATVGEVARWLQTIYLVVRPSLRAEPTDLPREEQPYVEVSASGLRALTANEYRRVLDKGRGGDFDIFLDVVSGEHGWRPDGGTFSLNTSSSKPLRLNARLMFLDLAMCGVPRRPAELYRKEPLTAPGQVFRQGRQAFEPNAPRAQFTIWPTREGVYTFSPHDTASAYAKSNWVFLALAPDADEIMTYRRRTSAQKPE